MATVVSAINENPAQSAPKGRLLRLAATFAGGNLISLALRMIGGILVARAVDPSTLGLFSSIGLVLGYLPFLQLGVLNGLNRELPYHLGGGRRETALTLAAAAQSWSCVVGALAALALLAIAGFYGWHRHWYLAAGWLTNALGAFAYFYSTYLQTMFRTSDDFARLATVNMTQNAIALGLVAAVSVWGFFGLCIRTVISTGAQIILLHRWTPVRVKPSWCWTSLVQLAKIGLPIFIVGQLYAWWAVLDATVVLRSMGTRAVGLYTLCTLTTSVMYVLPLSVAQVVYPRMAEQVGRDPNPGRLLRISVVPTAALIALMLPVTLVAWWALPPFVIHVVPKYQDGIAAAKWAVVAASVFAALPPLSIYNVVRRQDLYTVALAGGMLSYGGALLALTRSGWHLTVFPQAMLIGNSVFLALSYFLLYPLFRRLGRIGAGAGGQSVRTT